MTVAPGPIIENVNVIEDIGPGQIPGFVYSLPEAFFFQRTEEQFGQCIIQTVATPAHARSQVIGPAEELPVVTAVLTTLIAMYDDLAVQFSAPDGHQCYFLSANGFNPVQLHDPAHPIFTAGFPDFVQNAMNPPVTVYASAQ